MDPDFVTSFSQTVDHSAARMLAIADAQASTRPAPDKWSRKEIVGHMIDSAANNQARFVLAQFQDDLTFAGYDQDAWVRVQRYQERSWSELVQVWRCYNHQIAGVMRATSRLELDRPRARHNVHEIAFEPLSPGTPATLSFLMRDYIVHLEHHLRQVLRA